jgi:hypothetical protein
LRGDVGNKCFSVLHSILENESESRFLDLKAGPADFSQCSQSLASLSSFLTFCLQCVWGFSEDLKCQALEIKIQNSRYVDQKDRFDL